MAARSGVGQFRFPTADEYAALAKTVSELPNRIDRETHYRLLALLYDFLANACEAKNLKDIIQLRVSQRASWTESNNEPNALFHYWLEDRGWEVEYGSTNADLREAFAEDSQSGLANLPGDVHCVFQITKQDASFKRRPYPFFRTTGRWTGYDVAEKKAAENEPGKLMFVLPREMLPFPADVNEFIHTLTVDAKLPIIRQFYVMQKLANLCLPASVRGITVEPPRATNVAEQLRGLLSSAGWETEILVAASHVNSSVILGLKAQFQVPVVNVTPKVPAARAANAAPFYYSAGALSSASKLCSRIVALRPLLNAVPLNGEAWCRRYLLAAGYLLAAHAHFFLPLVDARAQVSIGISLPRALPAERMLRGVMPTGLETAGTAKLWHILHSVLVDRGWSVTYAVQPSGEKEAHALDRTQRYVDVLCGTPTVQMQISPNPNTGIRTFPFGNNGAPLPNTRAARDLMTHDEIEALIVRYPMLNLIPSVAELYEHTAVLQAHGNDEDNMRELALARLASLFCYSLAIAWDPTKNATTHAFVFDAEPWGKLVSDVQSDDFAALLRLLEFKGWTVIANGTDAKAGRVEVSLECDGDSQ